MGCKGLCSFLLAPPSSFKCPELYTWPVMDDNDYNAYPSFKERGFQYMLTVAQSEKEKETRIIRAGAQYNIGRAYFQVRCIHVNIYAVTRVYI